MVKVKTHSIKWFTSRVNKRIFRNYHECCFHCSEVAENGLIVNDSNHAEYLYWIQNDYANEGVFLNYRDKK